MVAVSLTGMGAVTLPMQDRLSGLTDLAIWNSEGGAVLYAVGRGGSWLSALSLGTSPGEARFLADWQVPTTYLQLESTEIVLRPGMAGADILLVGLRDTDLRGRDGAGGMLSDHLLYDAGSFDMGRISDLALDETGTTALATLRGGGIVQLRFDANARISVQDIGGNDATTTSQADAITTFSYNGALYGVSVHGEADTVALLRLNAGGQFVRTDTASAADGAWINTPGAVTAVTGADGKAYVVVAASGSQSLTVFAVEDDQMTPVAHLLDDRNTRFANAAFVQAITIEGQPYVIAAGSDQGITILALLPGGMLVPVATEAASLATPINGISALSVHVEGATARIFLATQGAPYLVEFAFSLQNPGQAIAGSPSNGTLVGGTGDDVLTGQGGDDSLSGGAGDDILSDGAGTDTLQGGDGSDLFVLGADGAVDTVIDFQPGIDRLMLQSPDLVTDHLEVRVFSRRWGAEIQFGSEILVIRTADGSRLYATDFGADILSFSQNIVTNIADYYIPGPDYGPEDGSTRPPAQLPGPMPAAPVLYDEPVVAPTIASPRVGSARQDFLIGGTANDQILAQAGNDILYGGGGGDILMGETGFDTIHGGDGNDTLSGGGHADSLYGGAGDDILVGGEGFDQIFGGIGHDMIWGGSEPDRLYGGEGNDMIRAGTNYGYSVDGLYGEAGNDTLYGDAGFDHLDGGDGDDWLDGGAQADNLFGRDGNDTLVGGQGLDRLFGGNGNDLLMGGEGPDGHFGDFGDDTLIGGEGDDRFFGGSGNDLIDGGEGNDTINATAGFDTLIGGAGDDILYGRFNADVFVFADGHGHDRVMDFDALNLLEVLDFSGLTRFQTTTDVMDNARQDGTDVVITTGPNSSIRLVGVDLTDLDGTDFLF